MSNVKLVMDMISANPSYVKTELVERIMREFNTTKSNAQTYIFNANRKLGTPAAPKAPSERQLKTRLKVEKAIAIEKFGPKAKTSKAKLEKSVRSINASFEKSADEIAKIKEANLKRMREVSSKYLPGQVSDESRRESEYVDSDEMARRKAEIDAFVNYETNDLPSFQSPSKLSMDDVKALV